jgi:NADPH2:quinone reductase
MRAVWLEKFGGPEVLAEGDAPDPVPGSDQVLVEVAFAGVTFVETQTRGGVGPFRPELPVIPGNAVGGVVTSVGAGVDRALLGRPVVSGTGGSGGYAQRAVVDAAALFAVPGGVALDAATALLADGRTAMMLVRAAALRRGERVLVEAAAGGVGSLLVQLVRASGATVVAAAGGPRKLQLVRDLGARTAVDYTEPGWTRRVLRTTGGLDVVFDGVGGAVGRSAFDLLDRGGRMLCFGLASGTWTDISDSEAADRAVTVLRPRAAPAEMRAFTEAALAEAAAGRLRPVIGQRFPLSRAADAHAAIESRATVGKTLLVVR